MNTNSKLPTKLHRALSAVKNYLDRWPSWKKRAASLKSWPLNPPITFTEAPWNARPTQN